MITKSLLQQSLKCRVKKVSALIVFVFLSYVVSYSQNGLTPAATIDLGGTITKATVLDYLPGTNPAINFLIQKGAGAPYFFVGNDGKVGIGTATPNSNSLLHVNGNIALNGDNTSGQNRMILGGTPGVVTSINMCANGGFEFTPGNPNLVNAGLSSFFGPLKAKGYFSVSSFTDANYLLAFQASDNTIRGGGATTYNSIQMYDGATGTMSMKSLVGMNFLLGTNGNTGTGNNFIWATGASITADEKMRLTKAGNLGIGVAPAAANKLEVAGNTKTTNFQMTNGAAANYVLTSADGNGNAVWKDPATLGGGNTTCDIIWTACKLGLNPGTDISFQLQTIISTRPEIHTIWFESHDLSDLGNNPSANAIFTIDHDVNFNGIVLKFERGNKLIGKGTISNFIIDASYESEIFATSLTVRPIATKDGWFSVKWFGAKGNDDGKGIEGSASNDDYDAIQTSINTCTHSFLYRLIIPSGKYKIGKPLIVKPIKAGYFVTLEIWGQANMWGGNTQLTTTFNNTFAIGIQLGKGCRVKNISIAGKFTPPPAGLVVEDGNIVKNNDYTYFDRDYTVLKEDDPKYLEVGFGDHTNVLTGDLFYLKHKARDKQYSPYAGIVIDPFTNTANELPADQLYPGLEGEYGSGASRRSGSTDIEIEDVHIGGFVVGVVSAPNGVTLNAELTKISRSNISNCKIAVSGGQSQEKDNVIDGLACWGGVHTVFATGVYGASGQAGVWNLKNFNIAGGVVMLVFNPQQNWYPIFIDNIYAEDIGSFGMITGRSSASISNGTQVSNSVFNFALPAFSGYRRLANTDGAATFKNCTFRYYEGVVNSNQYGEDQIQWHAPWKENKMMIFNCLESVFEDCKFSGVPVQEKEMSLSYYNKSFNIYKNCTAAKYTFGQDVFKYANQLTADHLVSLSDDIDHVLFNNRYKIRNSGQERYNWLTENYEFEGKETFVNFLDKNFGDPVAIKLTTGTYTDANNITHTDFTRYFTQVNVANTDAYYIGGIVVFSSYVKSWYIQGACEPVGYGIITKIDRDRKTLWIAYLSNGVKGTDYWITAYQNDPAHGDPWGLRDGYYISCLYPAVQSGSFMGDIAEDRTTIKNVAPDYGVQPEEYVGNLIKCPYNQSINGWVKIVRHRNETGTRYIQVPDPTEEDPGHMTTIANPSYDVNAGEFETLGNGGTVMNVNGGDGKSLYFNNGATKTVETNSMSNTTVLNQQAAIIYYRGEKLLERAKSDFQKEYVCVKTGYYDPIAMHTIGIPGASPSEIRKACIVEIQLPECGSRRPVASNTSNAWDLNGNTIIAAASEKGVDSSDVAADADTSQFLGTKNNVGLRIRTGDKERMAIDKNGVITVGSIDLSTITNHKDPKQNYLFAVKGNAIFERAVVKLSTNWPDYVFDDKYALLPLAELELYIKENKHLPGLPAAEEVQNKGIDLGNNQAALLNKLEELTLYVIEQNRKAEEQSKEIKVLKEQNNLLLEVQKQIDELKKAISTQQDKK